VVVDGGWEEEVEHSIEIGGKGDGRKGSVDPIYGFCPLYLLLQRGIDLPGA
jgi:hypothetical protein